MNLAKGIAAPLPWWLDFFTSAGTASARPWEMVDPSLFEDGDPPPMRFWHRCSLLLAEAESIVQDTMAKRQAKEHR
jgi:hypothetical protein